mgnify:CR=1 FL=1
MNHSYKRKTYSAGILPFCYDDEGNILFLLGKDTCENTWSDFGGRAENRDYGNKIYTAAREFYEESMGTIMNMHQIKMLLKDKKNFTMITTKTLNGSPYYTFVTKINYNEYSEDFQKRREFNIYANMDNKFLEKKEIRWVSKETLLNSLDRDDLISLRHVFKSTMKKKKSLISDIGVGTLVNSVSRYF